MARQKNILNNSLTLLTTITNSLTPSTISPILSSISSSPTSISPTSKLSTKLPKEPPPNKQTKKHHRKLSFLYKQVEHMELKLLFKRAFIERELLCKLELAKKIKDDISELELNGLVEFNQIRSKMIFLQNRNRKQRIQQNRFQIKSNSCSSFNKNSLNKNDNSLSNKKISKKLPSENIYSSEICLDDLSIDDLSNLLDRKEKEMNSAIQSSQNQIEELLKDAYDYLEEEEYLKLDIQDIRLEIEDLETMCI